MKILNITKVENYSDRYDIQTGTENFFANGVLVHNSMIHTVINGDLTRLKSKKSFDSGVAKAASEFAHDQNNYVAAFKRLRELNATGIFEWTAPDARIVLAYAEPQLTLLHVRNNLNGEYWDSDAVFEFALQYSLPLVEEADEFFTMYGDFNYQKLLAAAETREGIEGWIVQFEDGEMVKVKTKWYLSRHHLFTAMRERDVAEAVLNETIDDIKSKMVMDGVCIDEVLEIENRVVDELNALRMSVESLVESWQHLDRKSFAIQFTGLPTFGLMMKVYLGADPDYRGYFEKNMLKSRFTLRQLKMLDTVAESD
jgi:RNA ligase